MRFPPTIPFAILFALAFAVFPRCSHGQDSGAQVIVVYNTAVPESKAVADYYARKRNVPGNQVFGFELNTGQEMSRAEFRESLQKPLAKLLSSEKLWHFATEIIRATNDAAQRVVWRVDKSKVRYVVLCYGVPVAIAKQPNFKELGDDKLRPELRRDEAAVDSELALLPLIEESPPLAGPLRNPVYSATNTAEFSPTNGLLMVTRLDGPTAEIARGLVDKAMEAETNGLWGRAYFDLRGITDPGYKMGDDWMRASSKICERLGFETVVDEKPATFPPEFPMSQIAVYCGWYDANVSGPFTLPRVEFMPGAFAYHLHSFSAANLRSPTANWVGPLLAKGVTITMGCVYEPYLTGTPQPAIFLARLLYDRMTFGEAAYASQPVLSWQTTFVGDPLYCPLRLSPQQLEQNLLRTRSSLADWPSLKFVDLNLAKGVPPVTAMAFLEQNQMTRHSAILSEKLADLCAALGKPASAIELYQRALQLDASPMQRIRLRLVLGEKLTEAGSDQEAYDNYAALLQEDHDYPGKLNIYRKLAPLAQKLGRTDAAVRYEDLIKSLETPAAPDSKPTKP